MFILFISCSASMKRVVVASKNPVKINATQRWFEKMLLWSDFSFEGISVSSGVPDQPMSSQETYTWAVNRASHARQEAPDADYRVGIEGWVEKMWEHMEVFAWIVVLWKEDDKKIWSSKTWTFLLPPKLVELIEQWYELWDADDIVFWKTNSKQKNWAVWLLTHNNIDRTTYYEESVILALIPFLHPEFY